MCIKHVVDPLLNNFGHNYWIPSIVQITDQYQCKFITEIPNLPKTDQNMKIYKIFEQMLAKMMNKIEWMLGCDLRDTQIQIIVDIQHYEVKSNTLYHGNYHREGFKNSEYIKCGAIYYFNKTQNFFETDKFEVKSEGYQICGGSYRASEVINIDQNNLILLDNDSVIHRLNELKTINKNDSNKGEEIGTRSHILFLIPKYQITSIKDVNVNGHYVYPKLLNYILQKEKYMNDDSIPSEIQGIILKYLHSFLCGYDEMIDKRNEARKLRMNISNHLRLYLGATN